MAAKYDLVAKEIEQEILNGKHIKGKRLPTETELMKRYSISRNTVRNAIKVLAEKGYFYSVQGSGVFLRNFAQPGCISLNGMQSLSKIFPGKKLVSKVLSLDLIPADKVWSERMMCPVGTMLYHVSRLRFLDGKPFDIEDSYYNKSIVPYLNVEICEGSIFQYITSDLNLSIGFADKVVSSEKLNKEEAKLLELEQGDPALIVNNTIYLNTGIIFDISRDKFHYKDVKMLALTNL